MHRRPLLELLARYASRHPDEGGCVERVRSLALAHADCFERRCLPGHLTGSAWVLSTDRRRFLLTHHRKLDRWLQLGGHADGDPDLAAVALREASEESGLGRFAFLDAGGAGPPLPIDLDVHAIPARAGEPSHEHHDLRFALVAQGGEARASGESHALRWFEMDALDSELAAIEADASLVRLGRKVRALLAAGSPVRERSASVDPPRSAAPAARKGGAGFELGPLAKVVYASGDFTLNTALSALSLVYAQYFLVQVADVRPVLAGLIPLIGRTIDAFFDPLMGRISDRTRWRSGRRRPWFLIGALPYGALFALMWADAPFASAAARFAWYAAVYTLMNLAMSVLTVPYVAIQPEMALDYDARTSLNIYRTLGGTLGIFAAVTIEPLAEALGGGKQGFAEAGVLFGFLLAAPWLAVHRVTFERPDFRDRRTGAGFRESLLQTFRHRTFVQLTGIYIMGRIAMDLAAALLILFMSYWIGRREDFTIAMALFLGAVVLALPVWLAVARGRDKARVFVAGSLVWMLTGAGLAAFHPDSPRWAMFVYIPLVGIGFAVVDVMPWSMLGEVIDEDDLATGERREGLYNGMFTFLRKLGGAVGVFLVMGALDLFGYEKGHAQTDTAREAIRWMTALAPVPFLAVGVWLARGYPLTRRRHGEILAALAARAQREVARP